MESKFDYLKIMLSRTSFDILSMSELELDDNVIDYEIRIAGCISYRLDRNRHGAGFFTIPMNH